MRVDPDYKPPPPDALDFGGFDWPYDEANLLELWLKWEDNAFMPCAGDYFDQPPEWHQMIREIRRIYGVLRYKVELQVKARHPD